ncbi:MAG: endonuclease domain-containing protein [Fusobacteriaceae bacterium]
MDSLKVAEVLNIRHKSLTEKVRKSFLTEGVDYVFSVYSNIRNRDYPKIIFINNGLKLFLSSRRHITPEQYKMLKVENVNIRHTYTRFEISFGNMLEEYLKEFNIFVDKQFNVDGYRIDFYIPSKNICIEYDEYGHNSETAIIKDLERQKYVVEKLGCKFIRCNYTDSDVKNLAKVVKLVMY